MNELIQITPPATEPVLIPEMLLQLGMGAPADTGLDAQLTSQLTTLLLAARQYCENYTRTTFMTQTWLYQRDAWPGRDEHYSDSPYPAFRIPKPPFQSVGYLQYVDVTGTVQTLTQDTSYGSNANFPEYGYQLDSASPTDTRPARLLPPWARPWPPTRRVANAVMLQFKCGYGGYVTGSMAVNTSILVGPTFNPGDVGQIVNVPGGLAGSPATALVTTIASVAATGTVGQATLAASATAAVASTSQIYVGNPVPEGIRQAIKFVAQHFFTHGAEMDMPMPRVVAMLLDPYRNLVG